MNAIPINHALCILRKILIKVLLRSRKSWLAVQCTKEGLEVLTSFENYKWRVLTTNDDNAIKRCQNPKRYRDL